MGARTFLHEKKSPKMKLVPTYHPKGRDLVACQKEVSVAPQAPKGTRILHPRCREVVKGSWCTI